MRRLATPAGYLLDAALRRFEALPRSPRLTRFLARRLSSRPGFWLKPAAVQSLQLIRFRRVINWAYRYTPFYRERLTAAGLSPRDFRAWGDWERLPFTSAADLRDWRRFLAVPEDRLAAVFTTSGSTGEPKCVCYTAQELTASTNVAALGLRLGLPGRLVALVVLPQGLWMGSSEACRVLDRAGGLAIPVGTPDPKTILKHMRRFSPNVVISAPSYAVAFTAEAERQHFRLPLDTILLGGETVTSQHEQRLHDYWGAQVASSYGLTEIGGGQTLTLPGCPNLHLNGFHLLTEIIDPSTGKAAEEGELVFTPLVRQAMPLLRYRSGDRAAWGHCRCWPFASITLLGRMDDMFVVGDMNLFGRVIAQACERVDGATGRVAIAIRQIELLDAVTLAVEGSGVNIENIYQQLFAAYPELRGNLASGSLSLDITVVPLLVDQMKTVKIIDHRFGASERKSV